jgi:YggT family protein
MVAILKFAYSISDGLLSLLFLAIIISAVLSWLVAFDIINLRDRAVYQISTFLDRVTDPILRPFRRIIPPLGGVDISPIIVLLIIRGTQQFLLPALFNALIKLFGGGYEYY